ncbi:hypothetical protein L195_g031153 [Trifolium pratense]|uniref:Uncharacterized protein n=1 Tax=Trifolium pratense TaxID=57577 RepID=A0A2K3L9K5_TRIPR|nr:hypothetical protein L195_g031153 [Trifolium pratense]
MCKRLVKVVVNKSVGFDCASFLVTSLLGAFVEILMFFVQRRGRGRMGTLDDNSNFNNFIQEAVIINLPLVGRQFTRLSNCTSSRNLVRWMVGVVELLVGGETLIVLCAGMIWGMRDKDVTVVDMCRLGWGLGGNGWRWRMRLLAWEEQM